MEPFAAHTYPSGIQLFHIDPWIRRYSGITAGFSSRKGGESELISGGLNVAMHVGDNPEYVIANRRRIAEALQLPFSSWTCAGQVHGCEVAVVTVGETGRGSMSGADSIGMTDALITNERGVWLTSFYADCVPLYFFDPVKGTVGLAHAGWKGTGLKIAEKTVLAMTENYGSKPEHILAAIGPSIGGCCYEVDDHVIQAMRSALGSEEVLEECIQSLPDKQGKVMLDLKECNRQIMIKAGIVPTHIEITQWCTGCSTDVFFSHRKEHGRTGRMMSWIGLQEEVNASS
ncbi:peptidoglycan editing factor PgeF [Marinicrinis lubricantis]|uniref:Purine nucleoside phosphorylase n=1 Tax=Marinicrinis lubricantis TaxID=2086470 RepID=A0ABW1IS92_9BACL